MKREPLVIPSIPRAYKVILPKTDKKCHSPVTKSAKQQMAFVFAVFRSHRTDDQPQGARHTSAGLASSIHWESTLERDVFVCNFRRLGDIVAVCLALVNGRCC